MGLWSLRRSDPMSIVAYRRMLLLPQANASCSRRGRLENARYLHLTKEPTMDSNVPDNIYEVIEQFGVTCPARQHAIYLLLTCQGLEDLEHCSHVVQRARTMEFERLKKAAVMEAFSEDEDKGPITGGIVYGPHGNPADRNMAGYSPGDARELDGRGPTVIGVHEPTNITQASNTPGHAENLRVNRASRNAIEEKWGVTIWFPEGDESPYFVHYGHTYNVQQDGTIHDRFGQKYTEPALPMERAKPVVPNYVFGHMGRERAALILDKVEKHWRVTVKYPGRGAGEIPWFMYDGQKLFVHDDGKVHNKRGEEVFFLRGSTALG